MDSMGSEGSSLDGLAGKVGRLGTEPELVRAVGPLGADFYVLQIEGSTDFFIKPIATLLPYTWYASADAARAVTLTNVVGDDGPLPAFAAVR